VLFFGFDYLRPMRSRIPAEIALFGKAESGALPAPKGGGLLIHSDPFALIDFPLFC